MANNQEFHRLTSSSDMDEQTMREIYLASFEGMVKKEKPWTIMNSYNKLNGTYVGESKVLLTDILRKEWGFDGYVMTDWGAINERVDALKAGCNLEMPGGNPAADAEIIFAGLPDSFESEGYDRKHLRLPDCQNTLIEAVAAVQPNVVVVFHNGAPVEMPWIRGVKAVLEAYLGGQAVGGATVNILYGNVNPSGHLAETFPLRLQDTPCYLNYGGEHDRSVYSEGVFVGYRYYASKEMEVLFADVPSEFHHGRDHGRSKGTGDPGAGHGGYVRGGYL